MTLMTYLKASGQTLFIDNSFQKFHKYRLHGILILTSFKYKMMKNFIKFYKIVCKMQIKNILSSFKNFKMIFNARIWLLLITTYLLIPKTGLLLTRIKLNKQAMSQSLC